MAGGSRSRSPSREVRRQDTNFRDRDRDRNRGRDRDDVDRRPDDSRGNDGQDKDRAREPPRDRDRERSNRDRDRGHDRGERPRNRQPRGGFRWKEHRRDDIGDGDGDVRNRHGNGPLERGYRNRSPRRAYDRERDRNRHRAGGRDDYRDRGDNSGNSNNRGRDDGRQDDSAPAPPRRAQAPAAPPGVGEEMIVVHVNDRLGTKASIPCFASDRIGQFKVMVAGKIGREPHEILLKRQGERPFKDQLTLEDYGVGNGVQLDLEVDTGD